MPEIGPIDADGSLGELLRSGTEAEAVSFVVCIAIGLDTGTAAQDYVGSYGGDAKLLSESLEYVQRTSSQILNAIHPT